MALINNLITSLKSLSPAADGILTIEASQFNEAIVDTFFINAITTATLCLTNAVTVTGSDGLSGQVTGTGSYLGYSGMALLLSFEQDPSNDTEVIISLTASFPENNPLSIPALTWLNFVNANVVATVSSANALVFVVYNGALLLKDNNNSLTIPIALQQSDTDEWTITVAQNTNIPLNEISLLAALINEPELSDFFPQVILTALSDLFINDLVIRINTQNHTVTFISLVLNVAKGWNIVADLSIDVPLAMVVTLVYPMDANNRQLIGMLTGTIAVGAIELPVFIQAGIGGTTSTWMVGLQPGKTPPFNALSDILSMTGETDLLKLLPAAVSSLPTIQLNELELSFIPANSSIDTFQFGISTASVWEILPGYFEVDNIEMDLLIANVSTPATRTISGQITSTFGDGNMTLNCTVQKEETGDWTFLAGLPPAKSISMQDVAGKLFEGKVALPTALESIVITELSVNIDLTSGLFSFNAQSLESWWIVPNLLSITGLGISFTRTPNTTTPDQYTIAGKFTGNILVGNIPITLMAQLSADTAWQFNGSAGNGTPILMTDLTSLIAEKFNITALPAFLQQVALETLDISYNTGSGNFQFNVSASMPLANTVLKIQLALSISNANQTYVFSMDGQFLIGSASFVIKANDSESTGAVLNATWTDSSGIDLNELIAGLGLPDPELPADIDIRLTSADLSYNSLAKTLSLTIGTNTFGNAVLAVLPDISTNNSSVYFFGITVNESVNLSNLPLIGKDLSAAETICVNDFQILISPVLIGKTEVPLFNAMIPTGYPMVPVDSLPGVCAFSMNLQIGNDCQTILIDGSTNQTTANPILLTPAANGGNSTKWINVQQSFGPVTIQKIGVQYQDSILWFVLDASLSVGGLNITLNGAAIGCPISSFAPKFNLEGLSFDYQNPPIEIGGGFLSVPAVAPVDFEYSGDVVIKTPGFSIAAVGSYASINHVPSMFVFASVQGEFGGPPFFFVTGILAGFGYNRGLRIPTQSEVFQFPFVAGLTSPDSVGGTSPSPSDVMAILEGQNGTPAWITPEVGENWLAAGLMFTSFELVNSTVLFIAEFGQNLTFALMGLSTARFPQAAVESYAVLQLELEAVYQPSVGFLGITAMLTPNSFVIDPSCKLTGGFAFYMWMEGNAHDGDFVITAGGYSPYFSPPSWYPQEPRLGFSWSIDATVSIAGDAYFALTPSAVMTGGGLQISYKSENLKAWFTAYADLLIYYKPFQFLANIGVTIGLSYKLDLLFTTKTVTAELDASLQLWGPPTGGTVYINWWVISFTIDFGASNSTQQAALSWSDFQQLLPANSGIKIIPVNGILATGSQEAENAWIVRPGRFSFSTSTSVPSSALYIDNASTTPIETGNEINIRPMQLNNLAVEHLVCLQTTNGTNIPMSSWQVSTNYRNNPQALWGTGQGNQVAAGDDQLVLQQISGLSITVVTPVYGATLGAISMDLLDADPLTPGILPLSGNAVPDGPVPENNTNTIEIIEQNIASPSGISNRNTLYQELLKLNLYSGSNDSMINFATSCDDYFTAEPMITNYNNEP